MRIWTCKIGAFSANDLPPGADGPMRDAIAIAFESVTAYTQDFIFSGWGGTLSEGERAVVENRPADLEKIVAESPDLLREKHNDELTAANARIAELEQSIKRQAAAALAGMNATKAVSSWEIQEARRLKAECSPASIASQREANEVLTNELQAATVRIAELEALLGEAPHTWACHKVMSVDTETGAPIHLSDRVGCSCFKSRA